MANVEFRLASGQSLGFLDVAPMISALRFQPADFEFAHGSLHHVPESSPLPVRSDWAGDDRRDVRVCGFVDQARAGR